jgi:hypothetical protein
MLQQGIQQVSSRRLGLRPGPAIDAHAAVRTACRLALASRS